MLYVLHTVSSHTWFMQQFNVYVTWFCSCKYHTSNTFANNLHNCHFSWTAPIAYDRHHISAHITLWQLLARSLRFKVITCKRFQNFKHVFLSFTKTALKWYLLWCLQLSFILITSTRGWSGAHNVHSNSWLSLASNITSSHVTWTQCPGEGGETSWRPARHTDRQSTVQWDDTS